MKPDVKKLVLSLLPYVFIAWLFGKGAECYRLSDGADMVTKLMGAVSRLGDARAQNTAAHVGVHNFKCKGSLYGRTGGYAHD